MTKVIVSVHVETLDGNDVDLGTLEYTLDTPYEQVDELFMFQQVKADPRASYSINDNLLEIMGNLFFVNNVKRIYVVIRQKENLALADTVEA